jgi:hypothetical protein
MLYRYFISCIQPDDGQLVVETCSWYDLLLTESCSDCMCTSAAVALQAWTDPEGSRKLRLPDFVTMVQDGGRFSALRTGRPPLPPRKYFWYLFLLEAESTPGPECYRKDFMSMKNPLTPAGIEPATFRFVPQHFNHCGPPKYCTPSKIPRIFRITEEIFVRILAIMD